MKADPEGVRTMQNSLTSSHSNRKLDTLSFLKADNWPPFWPGSQAKAGGPQQGCILGYQFIIYCSLICSKSCCGRSRSAILLLLKFPSSHHGSLLRDICEWVSVPLTWDKGKNLPWSLFVLPLGCPTSISHVSHQVWNLSLTYHPGIFGVFFP